MLKEHLKVSPKVMIETREYKQGEYEKLVEKLKAEKRERNRKYKQKQKENEKSDQSKKKIQTSLKSQAKKENEIPIENVISQSSNTETKKKRKKNMMVEASDNFASIESFTWRQGIRIVALIQMDWICYPTDFIPFFTLISGRDQVK